jgi:(p)ppGpp synthase/HD superfamily hydrolase
MHSASSPEDLAAFPRQTARAFELAAMWHGGQMRKHPAEQIPYIAHPGLVAILLQRAGYDDEVVAAGVLHDVVEDCGISKEQVSLALTPRVADLVMAVTELPQTNPWAERKIAYRKVLETAPIEALAIAAADHVANIQSILRIADTETDIWSIFHASKDQKLVHEEETLKIIEQRLKGPLTEMLRQAIDVLKALPN